MTETTGLRRIIILIGSIGAPFLFIWETVLSTTNGVIEAYWSMDTYLFNKILSVGINLIPWVLIYTFTFLLVIGFCAIMLDILIPMVISTLSGKYTKDATLDVIDAEISLLKNFKSQCIHTQYKVTKYIIFIISVLYSMSSMLLEILAKSVYNLIAADSNMIYTIVIGILYLLGYMVSAAIMGCWMYCICMIIINFILFMTKAIIGAD